MCASRYALFLKFLLQCLQLLLQNYILKLYLNAKRVNVKILCVHVKILCGSHLNIEAI